jgi:transmembrane sensor
MSDAGQYERNTATGAEAADIQAADWLLARRTEENWSEQRQEELDTWLAKAPENLLAYWRLEAAWTRAERLKALRPSMRQSDKSPANKSRFRLLQAAAFLGIAVLAGVFGFNRSSQPSTKSYITPVGGQLTVALKDGSKIELNTDTVLRISADASRRAATLEKGEAYFEIKHDASRPFTLVAAGHRITDLGTQFSVHREGDRVQVALIDGSARVEEIGEGKSRRSRVLSPGDVAVATPTSLSVTRRPELEVKQTLSWRHGVLVFDNTTLANAASELNRYNREQIIVSDPSVARLTIGGTFPDNDVQAVINVAHQVFGLKVERNGDEISIHR